MSANLGNEPPAASLAFTSKDALIEQAWTFLESGRFAAADFLLSNQTDDPAIARARDEAREIIRRLRLNYSLRPEELLKKIQASIPDATAEDLVRWTAESGARSRKIESRRFFFQREPRNIFLHSKEAQVRRALAGNEPPAPCWKLTDHLQAVVAEAERTGSAEVLPVRHKITHTLVIRSGLSGMKPGSLVRAWLPFPQEYRQQRDVRLVSASPEPKLVAPSGVDGNAITGAAQRSVYFEHTVVDAATPIEFKVACEYTSFAYYPRLEEARVKPLPPDWNGAYLGERLPHIVFSPAMQNLVGEIVGGEINPLARARQIFRWVSANLQWHAEDEYCTIPSFALRGLALRRGDCGVLNTVFITLCRVAGIPARWQSGFETLPVAPGGGGMHDWSEIYIAPWGWLPADASTGTYALQKSDDPRIAEFYCGHLDSYRTIVNLDWGRELHPPKGSLRSEPADFQRGEVEVDGRNLYFDDWDYRMTFERF